MAKLIYLSDLHCDHRPFDPERHDPGDAEGVLVAGDINERGAAVSDLVRIWDAWRIPVIAIPGNHDFVGSKRYDVYASRVSDAAREARDRGARIWMAPRLSVTVGDVRVIAATLWTDHRLDGGVPGLVDASLAGRDYGMIEYRKTFWKDEARGIYRKMVPSDTRSIHRTDLAFMRSSLAKPHDGPTVVMTHHLPTRSKLAEADRDDLACAYASDLEGAFPGVRIDAWICGHSHGAPDVDADFGEGSVPVLSNCRGRPGENPDFDPVRALDTDNPFAAMRPASQTPAP